MQQKISESYKNVAIVQGASTIRNEIKKLRSEPADKLSKIRLRWIWELIQNAEDCCPDEHKIDITINYDEQNSKLTFSHNGTGFSYDEIRGLILQSSSKSDDDDPRIGKFGTGFITTTLLAPKIKIDSILLPKRTAFSFELDRSGSDQKTIKENIKKNLDQLDHISESSSTEVDVWKSSDTFFTYDLNLWSKENKDFFGEAREAVKKGIESLLIHLPYILATLPKINSIIINNEKYEVIKRKSNDTNELIKVSCGQKNYIIWQKRFPHGSLLIPMEKSNDEMIFSKIPSQVTKLISNFPLIGTEKFPFPVPVNSSSFDMNVDRDNIFGGNETNKNILQEAEVAYKSILQTQKHRLKGIANICHITTGMLGSFESEIQKEVTDLIYKTDIVRTSPSEFKAILNDKGKKQIFIPQVSLGITFDEIWDLISKVPQMFLPEKENAESWRNIVKNDIVIADIKGKMFENQSFSKIDKIFKDSGSNFLNWLNEYYSLCGKIQNQEFLNSLVVPNMLGTFVPITDIHTYQGIDTDLKNILLASGAERKESLAYEGVDIGEKSAKNITMEQAAVNIEEKVNYKLTKETSLSNRSEEDIALYQMILTYFKTNPSSKNFLPKLYENRSKLHSKSLNDQINHIVDLADEKEIDLGDIIQSIEDATVSSNNQSETKDLQNLFEHNSIHTLESKRIVDEIIDRTVSDVYEKLTVNPNYVLPDSLEQWKAQSLSKTVFRATKNKKPINLVLRPADKNRIIFYYDEEISVLDSNQYELWVDDEYNQVKQFTLGSLLKTTGVTMVPLENIFGDGQNND